ncbi:TPA: hypothetical protein N0F65_004993 [Lagenidium giganteum]|uniref:Chromo domain-containing protein n=1 Tax=Lagenidium giganteum TaxID=4803 RepID=A0AAV2ZCH1_9STRA|nr:TPA: hypothetical protein N0F65_004993 [Lagenidium giganteum]
MLDGPAKRVHFAAQADQGEQSAHQWRSSRPRAPRAQTPRRDGRRQGTVPPSSARPRRNAHGDRSQLARQARRAPAPILDSEGQRHYHVECVLDHRGSHPHRQLLVKWLGYEQPTWESEATLLIDAPDVVADYRRSAQ